MSRHEAGACGKSVWLDCDPGHDDAIAICLALFAGRGGARDAPAALDVLGLSTTHGNTTGRNAYINAVRWLALLDVGPAQCRVWRGADQPLLRSAKVDVGIHGDDGLGGVTGLPDVVGVEDTLVERHFTSRSSPIVRSGDRAGSRSIGPADPLSLVQHQLAVLQDRHERGLPPITLIATGPLTNVALLLKMCPGYAAGHLAPSTPVTSSFLSRTIEQIVVMGGAAGVPGNRTPLAEWNILVDPEAADIVFNCDIPVVMAGLNVTHQAIFTPRLHRTLLGLSHDSTIEQLKEASERGASPLRRTLSSTFAFFADSYATEFGFRRGPPIHDMLCVAYVLDPSLFHAEKSLPADDADGQDSTTERIAPRRLRVQVDTSDGLAAGATVVDFYEQWPIEHDGWSKGGRNAVVLEKVDTRRLWSLFFTAVERAEAHLCKQSPARERIG